MKSNRTGVVLGLLLGSISGACGGGTASDERGVLQARSGPFDGDIALDSSEPRVGDHDVNLMLVDAQGGPLDRAAVRISPFMPAHGHGSNDVDASEVAPGHYVAKDIALFMPGVWELRVHVEQGRDEGELVASFEVR